MTISEMKKYFTEHLVPSKLYQIGGESNGRICLEKSNGVWEVFFFDNMKKVGSIFFKDETSACSRMVQEVVKVMKLMGDEGYSLA